MRFNFADIFLSKGVNYFTEDVPLQAILNYFGIKPSSDLASIGEYVSNEMMEASFYVDHFARPSLQTWSIMDERIDSVWISPEHSGMIKRFQDLGVIRKAVEDGKMMEHFLSGYLISDSGIFCTLTLTAQTAFALKKYASDDIRKKYLPLFTNGNNPWLGATYYTEIYGGSDLGSNRAIASPSGSKYILNSMDKYFASNAGLADAAIVTARTSSSKTGSRGTRIFFVPSRKEDGSLNYLVRRLKDKLGTIAVPTGEVELIESEGYLLGKEEDGIYSAMDILAISRIDDAMSALGIARKALWEAYLYASKRSSFGKKLIEHNLMLRDLLEMEADLVSALILVIYASKEFSASSDEMPPFGDSYNYARMLTHISKNTASWVSDRITRYCMEVNGGKGFLREFPMEKFHRDAIVTSIWEGTSNIQALDMLSLIMKKKTDIRLKEILEGIAEDLEDSPERDLCRKLIDETFRKVIAYTEADESQVYAKDILDDLAMITMKVHLSAISSRTHSSYFSTLNEIFTARHFGNERSIFKNIHDKADLLKWMSH